jgi:hypothetical protein
VFTIQSSLLDAERQGAIYLGGPLNLAVISDQISKALTRVSTAPLAAQTTDQGLVFHVARRSARVIDISSGCIRLELPPADTIPAKFRMAIPVIRRRLPRQAGLVAVYVARFRLS